MRHNPLAMIALTVAVDLVMGAPTAPANPHIVFVLVDDLGYSDVGFHNPAIKTPNFDELVNEGLILDRHYVFKYCSPSRASFLTGRWPHHVHQFNIHPDVAVGANVNITMLPAKLKKAGYSAHMVGKWHEGFFESKFLPVNRGFDTSSGFLSGSEDHFKETRACAVDFWKNHSPDTRNGTYDAYIYRDDLTDIFLNHDTNTPLFLYLALHNIHGPLEAPQEWLDIYTKSSTCKKRRTLQAMVSVADNVTGHVVELLQSMDMWENTIMVVSADNGGALCHGSNHPLKGSKKTFFEGGVRAVAFASGGLLPENMRGKTTEGFIHIADWYTTFCKLAGVDPSDTGEGKFPVDGLDVWPIITGVNSSTPHNEIVLGYNYNDRGAIIVGDYKLIVGPQKITRICECSSLMWSPLDFPCSYGPKGTDCDPYCLYNIVEDPEERHELSAEQPEVLKQLLKSYNQFSKEPRNMQDQGYHSDEELPTLPKACEYMKEHGGYWQPWNDAHN